MKELIIPGIMFFFIYSFIVGNDTPNTPAEIAAQAEQDAEIQKEIAADEMRARALAIEIGLDG